MMGSRSAGRWVPSPAAPDPGALPALAEVLADSEQRRAGRSQAQLRELLAHPERLEVHEELGALFGQVASVDDLNVLSALRGRPRLEQLMEATRLTQAEVEDVLHHLLWRGVVGVADD
jgi:hypothetical protein